MSEAINPETIGEYQHSEGVGSEQAVEEAVENSEEANPWDVEHLRGDDGLVAGKYKNIDDMVKSHQHAEAKLAELQGEKQSQNALAANEEKANVQAGNLAESEAGLIREFLEGDRTMTPELIAKAQEAGVDITGLELKSIKALQAMQRITDMVGGEETYMAMINDMSSEMSDAEKAAFTKDIQGSGSKYTLQGIHNAWLEKTGQRQQAPSGRIAGKAANVGSVKPYNSQGELLNAANRARKDTGFRAEYEARKNMTPDSILFNKK